MNEDLITEHDRAVLSILEQRGAASAARIAQHLETPVVQVRSSLNRLIIQGYVRRHPSASTITHYGVSA